MTSFDTRTNDDKPFEKKQSLNFYHPNHLSVSKISFICIPKVLFLISRDRFTLRLGADLTTSHGPLTRYAKLRVAHASGMSATFSPPPCVSDPDMHDGTYVTHVPWCMPGSLTSGFLWSRWREKNLVRADDDQDLWCRMTPFNHTWLIVLPRKYLTLYLDGIFGDQDRV